MAVFIIIIALASSAILYLVMGLRQRRRIHTLEDMIPIRQGGEAGVKTANEFSASTVASTISLATVVLAIYELAPYLGLWLLWTVFTTAVGILVVRLTGRRIYRRLAPYGIHLPSLHEFLGTEYNSPLVAFIGASCTSLGFLGAFAVELTVGSRFLSGLIPSIPPWVAVSCLALVGIAYTSAGGFRTVIITDRIQMIGIWLLIVALSIYHVFAITLSPHGVSFALKQIPPDIYNFTNRDGLLAFLIGIFVINVPTFLSDMSVWQRVVSSQTPSTMLKGLARSVISVSLSWGALVILACMLPAVTPVAGDRNPLISLVLHLSNPITIFSATVLFFTVQGLYAANLSTASTQLIAISHTMQEDIIRKSIKSSWLRTNVNGQTELRIARLIIIVAGLVAVGIVEILQACGFTIADLVFAIYGAQLGLFPPVFIALFLSRGRLQRLGFTSALAVLIGFLAGWASAVVGKVCGYQNLVFLAPAVSLAASGIMMGLPILLGKTKPGNGNAS